MFNIDLAAFSTPQPAEEMYRGFLLFPRKIGAKLSAIFNGLFATPITTVEYVRDSYKWAPSPFPTGSFK
jgi:hypothetical protein